MPRVYAGVMNPYLPLLRVVEIRRGRRRVLGDEVIEVDTDAGWLLRWRMTEKGQLLPGKQMAERVDGSFLLEFKEPADERPDAEAEWFPWTTGDVPPFKTTAPGLVEDI